jgi:hypothetical protein
MAWSIFSDGGGEGAAVTWARMFLSALGVPVNNSNLTFVYNWEKSEGGGGKYNPLNQSPVPGDPSLTSTGQQYGGGAADYVSWNAGIQGAVDFLHMSNYTQVYAALKAGNGGAAKVALWNSKWAASHYGYGKGWNNSSLPNQGGPLTDTTGQIQPYNATTNPTTSIDPKTLAEQYGYAYSMLQSIPDLKNLFNEAISDPGGQWTTERFTAALMNTNWYKQHSAAQRAYIAEGFADPATQKSQLSAQAASVRAAAAALGAILPAGMDVHIAATYLADGWNADQLQRLLSNYIQFDSNGALGGTSGTDEMTLRGLAQNNGVNLSNNWILSTAQHIANDSTSLQDAEGYIRKQAEALFPQYSKMIQGGQNMSDLAAPYMQDYQRILEVGPGQTNLFDPTMLKALQFKDPTGQNTTMPMWQFDQSLRDDPRWMKTQNAQDTTMGVAHGILQDFGFSI